MPLEERVRSASRCAMGVRNRGIPADLGGGCRPTSCGGPFCFRWTSASNPPIASPYGSQAEDGRASSALARELTALGYSTMAMALEVAIAEEESWLCSMSLPFARLVEIESSKIGGNGIRPAALCVLRPSVVKSVPTGARAAGRAPVCRGGRRLVRRSRTSPRRRRWYSGNRRSSGSSGGRWRAGRGRSPACAGAGGRSR